MTNEPFAYAAVAADGSESVYVSALREQAEEACREYGWTLVPLYAAAPESWQLVHENERLRDEVGRLRQRYAANGLQLSYHETEVLKSADALFQKCGLAQHAVVVRDILRRVEGQ